MRVHHCFVILCLVEEMDMERMDYFFLDSLAMVRVGTRCQPCFLLLSLCSFPWSGREFVADQVTISLHAQPPPSSTCCSTRVIPTMPLCLAYPPRPGIAHRNNPSLLHAMVVRIEVYPPMPDFAYHSCLTLHNWPPPPVVLLA